MTTPAIFIVLLWSLLSGFSNAETADHTTSKAMDDPSSAPPVHVNIATQCASLSLLGLSSSDLWLFNNLSSLRRCRFRGAVQLASVGSGGVILGGTARTTTKAYGSRTDGHCDDKGLRFAVKVYPDYVERWTNRTCSISGSAGVEDSDDAGVGSSGDVTMLISNADVADTLQGCREACDRKNGCMGFQFDPTSISTTSAGDGVDTDGSVCVMYSTAPSQGKQRDGAQCWAARLDCPDVSCGIRASTECRVDDSGSDCNVYVPSTTAGTCVKTVSFRYSVQIDSSPLERELISMMRAIKGVGSTAYVSSHSQGRVSEFIKPSVPIVAAGETYSTTIEEQIRIDFCKEGKVKAKFQALVKSADGMICHDEVYYKIATRGLRSAPWWLKLGLPSSLIPLMRIFPLGGD